MNPDQTPKTDPAPAGEGGPMRGPSKRGAREKNITRSYLAGDMDADALEGRQTFNKRRKFHQVNKTAKTAGIRAGKADDDGSNEQLPLGQVAQVYSLYADVVHEGKSYLCLVRKTMGSVSVAGVAVGDHVRFRLTNTTAEDGRPEAIIERIEPRATVLTRSDSFLSHRMDVIVANAEQMLIVASVFSPRPRWGLIDRMIIAAQSGGLRPIICLNKIDLAESADADPQAVRQNEIASESLHHYRNLGIAAVRTSAETGVGMEELAELLRDRQTVLAGHSGVGKSRLLNVLQPGLDIRTGIVSLATDKGRHTTTSARSYPLEIGGAVIDTPGVKVFGLWGMTRQKLIEFFPDVEDETAPVWRRESYQRILDSLG